MNARSKILARLGSKEIEQTPPSLQTRLKEPVHDPVSTFRLRLQELGGNWLSIDQLAGLQNVIADPECLSHLEGLGLEFTEQVWKADIGITMADWAIADTGSLLIHTRPDRRRLASLAPPTHVALVPLDRFVGTLEQAVEHLKDSTAVVVTGPSRTADIEGVLVNGMHGPGELWVCPVPGERRAT